MIAVYIFIHERLFTSMKVFSSILMLMICNALLFHVQVSTQNAISTANLNIQQKYSEAVNNKLVQFNRHTDKFTEKALDKIIRQEKKMQHKVAGTDSMLAKKLFSYSIDSLQKLKAYITGSLTLLQKYTRSYFPYIDTLRQSLTFLSKTKNAADEAIKMQGRLLSSISSVDKVESKLGSVENLERYIAQRQQVLKEQLKEYPQLADNLKKISRQAYYYSAQMKQYKETLGDPSKVEQTVLKTVQNLPAFQQLMQRNSALSGIFVSPASFSSLLKGGNIPVVNGLPSRASLQTFIQSNVPSNKLINPVQQITQQLPDPKSQISQFKDKLNKAGAMENQAMPDFRPNTQHTKSLWKRLEYGTDVQFGKGVSYLPATAAIAAKAGYKLNDKSTIGAGTSYMMGLGSGWKNIRFSTQAIGLRTYVTWKLKKGLDIQGGSEWNYMLQVKNLALPEHPDPWQQSVLLGLRKQYAAGKKLKGNVQVLYDFLYNRHMPASQPVVFRFGYSL